MPNKKGTKIKSPVIPILLKGRSSFSMTVLALIDSGADMSVIPKGLAEVLDLDLSKETQKAFGVGGDVQVKNSEMLIKIGKKHEKYEFKIPVQVILNDDAPIILGRKGFFNKFVIVIDEKEQRVKLKRKN